MVGYFACELEKSIKTSKKVNKYTNKKKKNRSILANRLIENIVFFHVGNCKNIGSSLITAAYIQEYSPWPYTLLRDAVWQMDTWSEGINILLIICLLHTTEIAVHIRLKKKESWQGLLFCLIQEAIKTKFKINYFNEQNKNSENPSHQKQKPKILK